MRFDLALPLLAGAASVSAQGLNFDKIFEAKPSLKSVKPTPTKSVDRAATASSIVAALSSAHAKTKVATTLKPTSKATPAKSTGSAKPATSGKAATSSKSAASSNAVATDKTATPSSSPKAKRQASTNGNCAAQSIAYGYQPTPNTPTAFLTDTNLINQATAALPPPGFTKLYSSLAGSMFANNYITYYPLSSYSPQQCADICTMTAGCTAINLYFERDPLQDPNSVSCPNPTAATSVRCALWGSTLTAAQARNIGEYRADFMVVIAGSNGYSKNTAPASITGFTGPSALSGLVNIQSLNGKNVTVGNGFYSGSTYDPTLCSKLCTDTTAANKAAAISAGQSSYNVCSYVDAALVSVNGVAQGTYCAMYSDSGVANYATLITQVYNSVSYDISYSYGYAVNAVDSGLISTTTTSATTTAARTTTALTSAATTPSSTRATTTASTTTQSLSAATPTGVSCSSLGGSSYSDLNGITYQTKCGYDLLNVGDIANAQVRSFSDCFTLCDVTSGCDGFAYVLGSNYCYMKSLSGVTTRPNASPGIDIAWLPSKYTDRSVTTTTSATTVAASTSSSRTSTATTTSRV